ncbi:TIGR00341 family protein [Flavobacterium flavipallidum]|uniref:TIGR00341 family protein n=1 Tax=Flavobacterium flavipallidum TaxID=3139140 RepID=A0ABU9HP77_9FLAO
MPSLIRKLFAYINLNKGEEDKAKVLENVTANISFRGSNLWILACAIVVASVGLNVNSTAVIIGAMLISPLMGPIVGAGFGLGTYDFELLKRSLKNLFIATIVSLIVSAIYFYISPFKEAQPELLSRTSPNFYDILIAFFGGIVGAVAITRVEKGNPIPGVAIATALMPPLCTAGYGLATASFKFFLGAMYLYAINCIFICISTFLIVKYLAYPTKKQLDEPTQKKVKYYISTLLIIFILPSIYFAYLLFEEKKFEQQLAVFTEKEFTEKGITIVYQKTRFNKNPKIIELGFLSKRFSDSEIKDLNKSLKDYDLTNTQLIVKQDTTDIKSDILNEIKFNKSTISQKDVTILNLKKEIEANHFNNKELLAEMKILFPSIENISISNHIFNEKTDSLKIVPVLIYKSKNELDVSEKKKIMQWLKQRLTRKQIEIYRQN